MACYRLLTSSKGVALQAFALQLFAVSCQMAGFAVFGAVSGTHQPVLVELDAEA
jgi:hypothetical protein